MAFINRRFAMLAAFCCLVALNYPYGGVGAAVVQHRPKGASRNQSAHHGVGTTADYDAGSLHHNQGLFSVPQLRGKDASKDCDQVKFCQKKRSVAGSNMYDVKDPVNHRRRAETPEWLTRPQENATLSNNTSSTSSSCSDTMIGTVAIVSNEQTLAHLLAVRQADGSFVLDASERDATEMILKFLSGVPQTDACPVELIMPLDEGPYCATYDQDPPTPEPLTAQPCTREGPTKHSSQIFNYYYTTSEVKPMYSAGQNASAEEMDAPSSASPSASSSASMGVVVAATSDAAFPTPSAGANSTSLSRRQYPARNVTLVFNPKRTTASEAAAEVQEVSTSTVTQTVTTVNSSTASSEESTLSPASASSSAAIAAITGLSVEVVGSAPSSVGLPSISVAAAPSGSEQSSQYPAASSSPSASMDPGVSAASVAASDAAASSASPMSPSATASVASVASVSPSEESAVASMSTSPATPSARAMFDRDDASLSEVSTDPYVWKFNTKGRFQQ